MSDRVWPRRAGGLACWTFKEPDGHWGGAAFVPRAWISTKDTLQLLRDLGVDPASDRVRRAIDQVRDRCTWGEEFGDSPFFEGEVEPCINGRVLAIGAYFGEATRSSRRPSASGAVERRRLELRRPAQPAIVVPHDDLRARRTAGIRDGEGSEARRHRRSPSRTGVPPRAAPVPIAIDRTDHHARQKTGNKPAWTEISFPTRWHYDILWGLDYLRRAGVAPDERMAEAIDLVRKKRDEHGRWPLENPHPGPVHFEMEGRAGEPSRWNTLRALRVLRWAGAS